MTQAPELLIKKIVESSCIVSVEYENSKRIKYIAHVEKKSPELFTTIQNNIIKLNIKIVPLISSKKNSFAFLINDKIHEVEIKSPGKNLYLGLHELLTAALLCAGTDVLDGKYEPLETLKKIKTILKSKTIVKGSCVLPSIFTESCYAILAQAMSAAKAIRKNVCKRKIDKIFLTDSHWPKEIKKFNIEKYGMKRYNSSDIVIKCGRKYFGISLKRKKHEYDKDPPFLNKSFRSILSKDPIHSHILEEYNRVESQVFSDIVDKAIKENVVIVGDYSGNWKEYIGKIDNKYINLCLQTNPIIQRFCSSVFLENTDLRKLLFTLALRNDIKELEVDNFYFSVILGIGNVRNDSLEVLEGKLINKSEQDLKISVRYNGRYSSGIICYI